jgi:hypothetical protein
MKRRLQEADTTADEAFEPPICNFADRRPARGSRLVARGRRAARYRTPGTVTGTPFEAEAAHPMAMAALDWVTKGNPAGEGGG